ncbi:TPA: hypothetical protein ACHFX4_004502 [Citrobacter freundii]|uniref:hypothetical protein n=1 Tax=Enterobacteriaceae TaxID=543 RepID=UPI002175BD5C|nr:hypothetical protein [Klebsiella aerogenes]EKZ9446472.1 hypothetical protein [Enterobacter hormaechei]HBR6265034.1 hypothetical protein [Klebsiella pneumoniae]ELJ2091889.1 hypothetical protein [Enterobacter hormaechei]UWC49433.1 hypothetical protein M5S98_25820 [Klebsiella aerogenes]HBX8243110.1 hypothetical protein [Klebsiella pneumoniae]
MSNSFDKPQTLPVHNSDAEPFFPKNLGPFIEQVSGRDLAMLTESEKEKLAHLIRTGRKYGVSVAIVPDTDSAELHELLSNADSIERQFSIYERILTKIAFTRCQEA